MTLVHFLTQPLGLVILSGAKNLSERPFVALTCACLPPSVGGGTGAGRVTLLVRQSSGAQLKSSQAEAPVGDFPFPLFPFSPFPPQVRERGVTLLELILVLVILTIVSGLVIPTIGSRLQGNDIRRDAVQLRAALSFMRLGAVRQGKEGVFVVDPQTNSYWREPGGESVAVSEDSGLLSARGRWTREEGAVEFHFYPDGTNSGGQVRIEKRQGVAITAYVVSLDPLLGTATIERDEE